MALWSEQRKILMNEGDYGLSLPFTITGPDIELNDKMCFTIKKNKDNGSLITKTYNNDYDGINKFIFALDFTKEESYKLNEGNYVYYLQQVRDGEIVNTIIAGESFIVRDGRKL